MHADSAARTASSTHVYCVIPPISRTGRLSDGFLRNIPFITMKIQVHHHFIRSLTIGVASGLVFGSFSATAAEDHANIRQRIIENSKQLEEKMSGLFHDTWKQLRDSVEGKARSGIPRSSASVDVREQNNGYTVRISLPGHDMAKVEVSLIGGNQLRIVAPAGDKIGRYEQTLVFDDLESGVEPRIEKKPDQHLIIVQIPRKPSPPQTAPPPPEEKPEVLPAPPDRWDRDILEHMERMRREMDDMVNRAFKDIGDLPEFDGVFDKSRFGSSVELQEEEGQYVVRAYLPERDMENVKVTIDEGRILKIDAMSEATTDGEKGEAVMKHRYSQILTLPGPVRADQLKVDRKQGMLVIGIPKKTSD
jgi:HSP20 family molecular chaperone IbpA